MLTDLYGEKTPTADQPVAVENSEDRFRDAFDMPAKMSPLAQKRLLNGVDVAGRRAVAVGVRGHILYSDDGGKSWTQCEVPLSIDLTAVHFPTPQKGWAVGHDGTVLHSADGGITWVKQLDGRDVCRILDKYYENHPVSCKRDKAEIEKFLAEVKFLVDQGPVTPFLDVWFENDSSGFIIGAFNLILHTEDGGKTWEPWMDKTDNPFGMHLYSIRRVGQELFICGEQGLVMKFDHRANCFKALQTPYVGTYFGILGTPKNAVIAFGMRGNIYRSSDGGATWTQIESGIKFGIMGGKVMENGAIVLVSQGGNVLLSKNDGMSFSEVQRERGGGIPLQTVAALDAETLIVAGMLGVDVQKIQ
jgi:photosystem II stability/assembly factor-like uncharacterized protein